MILAHRLLKNTVIEQGGPSSYGFFTHPCLTDVSTKLRLPAHEESIESFGPVTGVVQDLAAVAAQRREAQVVRLTDDDADVVFSYIVDAPPAVCWQYFVEPGKRLRQRGGCRDGDRVQAEQRGPGRDRSVKPLFSRRRRRWSPGVPRLETLRILHLPSLQSGSRGHRVLHVCRWPRNV